MQRIRDRRLGRKVPDLVAYPLQHSSLKGGAPCQELWVPLPLDIYRLEAPIVELIEAVERQGRVISVERIILRVLQRRHDHPGTLGIAFKHVEQGLGERATGWRQRRGRQLLVVEDVSVRHLVVGQSEEMWRSSTTLCSVRRALFAVTMPAIISSAPTPATIQPAAVRSTLSNRSATASAMMRPTASRMPPKGIISFNLSR